MDFNLVNEPLLVEEGIGYKSLHIEFTQVEVNENVLALAFVWVPPHKIQSLLVQQTESYLHIWLGEASIWSQLDKISQLMEILMN